jgi:hypothetical protein
MSLPRTLLIGTAYPNRPIGQDATDEPTPWVQRRLVSLSEALEIVAFATISYANAQGDAASTL